MADAIQFSPSFSMFRGNASPDSTKLQWPVRASLLGKAIPKDHTTSKAAPRTLQQWERTTASTRASTSAQGLRGLTRSQCSKAGRPSSKGDLVEVPAERGTTDSFLHRPSAWPVRANTVVTTFESKGLDENAGREHQFVNHLLIILPTSNLSGAP